MTLVNSSKVEKLAEGLKVLDDVQSVIGSAIPGWVEGDPEFIRTSWLALIVELSELLQLFNWKQWKDPIAPDLPRMADEFADVLAFFGYLVVYLRLAGLDSVDLGKAYAHKTNVNSRRLAGKIPGYGVQDNL